LVYLVDTVEVEPRDVDDYLHVLRSVGMEVMTDAGASFVSCATTSSEVGEAVHIQMIWAFDDFERWNEIRRDLVLDPRWYEYAQRTASLRTGGTRRFYTPTALLPPP
jgi:hypothetical protein